MSSEFILVDLFVYSLVILFPLVKNDLRYFIIKIPSKYFMYPIADCTYA